MLWVLINDKDEDLDVECAAVMSNHTQDVKRIVWHPHEDILASASYDDTIRLYENDESDGDWSNFLTLTGHESTVWAIDFDASGNRLASCSDDRTVKIWKKEGTGGTSQSKWTCACTIAGVHKRPVYDIAWNKSNGLIATASGDNHIRIIRETPGVNELEKNRFELAHSIKVSDVDVNCVKWNPKKPNLLVSTSDDGQLRLWEWLGEGDEA